MEKCLSKTLTFQTICTEDTHDLGTALGMCVHPNDVIVLTGDLGAGKTQLSQGLAVGLGIIDDVVSPTFNILLEYTGGRIPLFHFDLYRLEEAAELEDIDFYSTLEAGGVSLIEWGDMFPDELPDEYVNIAITADISGTRTITATAFGQRPQDLLVAWEKSMR